MGSGLVSARGASVWMNLCTLICIEGYFFFYQNWFVRVIIHSFWYIFGPQLLSNIWLLSSPWFLWKSKEGREDKITLKLVDLGIVEHLKEKRLNGKESRNRIKYLHLAYDRSRNVTHLCLVSPAPEAGVAGLLGTQVSGWWPVCGETVPAPPGHSPYPESQSLVSCSSGLPASSTTGF